ncbi:hypothetical protein FS749_013275 [Ceratobasidium sp. UAMH 11750]|nr:hypothetical protein FS749_013275 [Ceratobasidium sp. UAMH 11750]
MATAARCHDLNPLASSSTHHPQNDNPDRRTYSFVVPSNIGQSLTFPPDDFCLGPLGSLIDILVKHPGVKDASPVQACPAVLEAYSALAPVLLQQNLGLESNDMRIAFDIRSWAYAPRSDMAGIRFMVVRQALLTIRYLGLSRTVSPSHFRFLEQVLAVVHPCLSQDYGTPLESSYRALFNHNDDMICLLEFVNESDSAFELLTGDTKFNLLGFTSLFYQGSVNPCENLLTPNCFPPLIRMIGQTANSVSRTEQLLQAMVRRMRNRDGTHRLQDIPWNDIPAIEYIYPFTRTPRGFSALASAGGHDEYADGIVKAIIDIVHLAAGQDAALAVVPIELHVSAVPDFLDVVSVIAKRGPKLKDYDALIVRFSNDVLELVKVASKDEASMELLKKHSAGQELRNALMAIDNKDLTREVLERFHDMPAEWASSSEDMGQVEIEPGDHDDQVQEEGTDGSDAGTSRGEGNEA